MERSVQSSRKSASFPPGLIEKTKKKERRRRTRKSKRGREGNNTKTAGKEDEGKRQSMARSV